MAIDYCYTPRVSDWENVPAIVRECSSLAQFSQDEIDGWIIGRDIEWFLKEPSFGSAREVSLEQDSCGASDAELDAEIKRAVRILDSFEEEGVEEDAPFYTRGALNRATTFLTAQAEQLRKLNGTFAPVPNISPGPNGSVDLHWRRSGWEVLVNVPSDDNVLATFYGDNYGAHKIKGSFDPMTSNYGIIMWLMNS